jgi:hypothetical protein
MCRSQTPPAGGWLDELDRLKGGCGYRSRRRAKRALVGSFEQSFSIRALLLADVFLDLFQFEANCGHSVTPGPEMLSREIPFLAAQAGNSDRALSFEKPNHGRDWVLRRNGDAHMHMVRHQVPFNNLAFFLTGQCVKDWPQLPTRLLEQGLAPSFGNKDDMVLWQQNDNVPFSKVEMSS